MYFWFGFESVTFLMLLLTLSMMLIGDFFNWIIKNDGKKLKYLIGLSTKV
jgi:hypothetical protein